MTMPDGPIAYDDADAVEVIRDEAGIAEPTAHALLQRPLMAWVVTLVPPP
jgi:hypothetical protein